MVTEKFALRSGSSKHGKTFLASIDCSCEAAKYLAKEKKNNFNVIILSEIEVTKMKNIELD